MPDSSGRRTLTFFLLFVYHSAHALGKTYAMALLAQVSWLSLVAYMLVDHALFQLLKLLRGDFIYWVHGFGPGGSMLARFCTKVMMDFTGNRGQLLWHTSARKPTLGCLCLGGRISPPAPSDRSRRRLLLL